MSAFLASPRSIEKTRRDFITWLAAGTAATAVACTTSAAEDDDLALDEGFERACRATTRDAKGPYWLANAPVRAQSLAAPNEPGVRLSVEGKLVGPDCRTPLAGYALDVWQADAEGNYHSGTSDAFRLRGKIRTDAMGRYRFETVLPGRYADAAGTRPAHLHVSFLTPGGNILLTSQLYFEGDPFLGPEDYCTRQGTCNSADPNRHLQLTDGLVGTQPGKLTTFDAVLPRI
jgi:catechol 1,2-dioxygenase